MLLLNEVIYNNNISSECGMTLVITWPSSMKTDDEIFVDVMRCKNVSEFVLLMKDKRVMYIIANSKTILNWIFYNDKVEYLRALKGKIGERVGLCIIEDHKRLAGPNIQEYLGIGLTSQLNALSI